MGRVKAKKPKRVPKFVPAVVPVMLPWQGQWMLPADRDEVYEQDGRLYPATGELLVESELMRFDVLASLVAIVTGELHGQRAGLVGAFAFEYLRQSPLGFPVGDLGSTPDALVESFRPLVANGLVGRDEFGGYLNLFAGPVLEEAIANATPPTIGEPRSLRTEQHADA
ncbi:hypothetical protein ACEZDB_35990 [Streptacidiphilus sp. N1-3]|uniref:Uncharacterized protein n=1 Tax=Streptacidiphilus alkalitolerans TaxID=3342712 RepID=A0ABV6XDN5_9ACTN